MADKPLRIALGNKARVGKDTFADIVEETRTIHRLAFAADLKSIATNIQETLQMEVVKDPTLLQKLGTLLREHYGDDVFANTVIKKYNDIIAQHPFANVIVTDMREPIEMKRLTEVGFNTVKITRAGRPIDRNPNHSSEVALDGAVFDYYIENDGTMEEFRDKVKGVINGK